MDSLTFMTHFHTVECKYLHYDIEQLDLISPTSAFQDPMTSKPLLLNRRELQEKELFRFITQFHLF